LEEVTFAFFFLFNLLTSTKGEIRGCLDLGSVCN
jgi:hypothetical protein